MSAPVIELSNRITSYNVCYTKLLRGIPNRRHFDETLNNEWKRCLRTDSPLSLILIDVDLFKQYNDRYGHQAGDHCLKAVAAALNEALFRVEDSVARYGGEVV